MADSENKKLSDLKVVELRSELEKRGLESKGVKQVLHDRLAKALTDEGKDPETFMFDVNEKASDDKSEEKEPEKATEQENETNEDTADAEKMDTEEGVNDGHESPIRLTLEDDEAIQDVEGEEKVTNEDKKNDEGTSEGQEKKDQTEQSAEKKGEQAKDDDGSSKTGDNKLQKKVAKANPNVLWISNIAKNTRASELKAALSACGKVVGAKVVVNARFPGSSCFGYVTMGSVEDVENVIAKLNNTELNGQIIKIDKFDLVRAEQMKQMSTGKDKTLEKKSDEKKEGDNAEPKDGEKRSEHKSRGRSRHDSSSRKSDDRAKSASSKGRKGSRERRSRSGRREREVLTFEKIRAERERQRLREKERQLREEARRRQEEDLRRREADRRQRMERERLEREKEKLKMERERIEREKAELIRMERERQKLEREKIAREKMQLERTLMRLGEERKASKRPAPYHESYDDRKRSASDRHYDAPPPPSISSRPGPGIVSGSSSRMYERDSRGSRSDLPSRGKDGRYERERSPHYRPSARDDRRPIPDSKPSLSMAERLGRYENNEPNTRYDRNASWPSRPPQNPNVGSSIGSLHPKSWAPKDQWRQEPVVPDRWQTSQAPSRPYSGVPNSSGNLCPPPPGITSYPDSRFSSGMRKY